MTRYQGLRVGESIVESGVTIEKRWKRRRPHSPDRSEAAINSIPTSVLAGRRQNLIQNLRIGS